VTKESKCVRRNTDRSWEDRKIKEKRKDALGRKAALYLAGLVLLVVLFITADEVFNIPSLIFDIAPTPINWAEAGIESFVVIVAGFFVMLHLRRQWVKGKQAEEALRKSEERYRLILQSIVIFSTTYQTSFILTIWKGILLTPI